jgi:hypothetical protein
MRQLSINPPGALFPHVAMLSLAMPGISFLMFLSLGYGGCPRLAAPSLLPLPSFLELPTVRGH